MSIQGRAAPLARREPTPGLVLRVHRKDEASFTLVRVA